MTNEEFCLKLIKCLFSKLYSHLYKVTHAKLPYYYRQQNIQKNFRIKTHVLNIFSLNFNKIVNHYTCIIIFAVRHTFSPGETLWAPHNR